MASVDTFNSFVLTFDSRLRSNTWKEVYNVLRTKTCMKEPLQSPDLIAVQNGIFNLDTKELLPFNHNYMVTSKIKTRYNPNISKPMLGGWFDFDEWLYSIACGDGEIVTLLWQIMNEAINPNYTRKKIAILYGDGNNGKGTFQALLSNLIGFENIATLKPDQFAKEHYLSALDGKVCNIGDDISSKYLDEVSDLMSVASGDPVQVNPKHSQTYEATYRTLCLFSANELPRARSKATGWYRRLCIIPFNADFNGQKERPEIKNVYLKDKRLLEYVLYQVLHLPNFDKFIEPQAVSRLVNQYKKDNDYILSFVTDSYMINGFHEVNHIPLYVAKNELKRFLDDIGAERADISNFGKRIVKHLERETDNHYSLKGGKVKSEHLGVIVKHGYTADSLKKTNHGITKTD